MNINDYVIRAAELIVAYVIIGLFTIWVVAVIYKWFENEVKKVDSTIIVWAIIILFGSCVVYLLSSLCYINGWRCGA